MPDDSQSSSWFSSLPLPGILAVLSAVAGALLVQYEPLTPRRPLESGRGAMASINERKIDATLLEDPFTVVNRTSLVEPLAASAEKPAADVPPTAGKEAPRPPFNPKTQRYLWLPSELKQAVLPTVKRCAALKADDARPHRREMLVLPVLMRPFSDEASAEMRARQRQAVMSALYSSGYAANPRKIECLRLNHWNSDGAQDPSGGSSVDVPFEWASPSEVRDPHAERAGARDTRYAKVLVLWIHNDSIGSQGIVRLRELLDLILPRGAGDMPVTMPATLAEDLIIVRLLGPHSTEKLAQLVQDANDNHDAKDPSEKQQHRLGRVPSPVTGQWPGRITLVSQRATASPLAVLRNGGFTETNLQEFREQAGRGEDFRPEDILAEILIGPQPPAGAGKGGQKAGPAEPPLFLRTTSPDDLVIGALKKELERRLPGGVPWREYPADRRKKNPSGHIAIISEYDSPYGRGLAGSFINQTHAEKNPPWMHTYSYARGLDGSTHQPASGRGDADGKKGADRSKEDYKPDETPVGLNQIDGLRRMALQIEELDDRLQKEGEGRVIAIGVLGSDVYDKLLILRALRPRLKNALFFTNNIDAWFWQKDELPDTRNLIVGSAFGLALNDTYQRGVPPFRDSYQTGDFAGALAALSVIPPKVFSDTTYPEAVRIYEVGKDGPYDLSLERDRLNPATPLIDQAYAAAMDLHPPRADRTSWWMNPRHNKKFWLPLMLLLPLSALLLLVMAFLDSYGAKSALFRGSRLSDGVMLFIETVLRSTPAWVVLGFPCFALGTYKLWRMWHIEGEPYEWSAGISAWPSEVLRLMVVALAVHYFIKSALDLRDLNAKMEKLFDLQPPAVAANQPPSSVATSAPRSLLRIFLPRMLWMSVTGTADVQTLWAEFKSRSRLRWRIARSIPLVVALAFLAQMIRGTLDHEVISVRGANMAWFDSWCDLLSHGALIALAAFVADALWLNRSLVMRVADEGCSWPASYLAKLKGRQTAPALLGQLIDMRFIAARTDEAGSVVFCPFYLLGLLIIARLDCFDHWGWPKGLLLFYLGLVVMIISIALLIRRDAEDLRAAALVKLAGMVDEGTAGPAEAIKEHRAEIAGLRSGAFAPLSAQPAVRALVWALGTAGVGSLMQYFSRFVS